MQGVTSDLIGSSYVFFFISYA